MTRIEGGSWDSSRKELYRALLDEGQDVETLHDLLVSRGPALLDRSLPYLIVAIRNRARSRARREVRRTELERDQARASPSVVDPADRVSNLDELDCVLQILDQLDRPSLLLLWWQAAGFGDDEIVELWTDAGLEPPDPSSELMRKRRQRARAHLRSLYRRES